MRWVIAGAGATGGVVGARLFQHGHDVELVARGEHGERIRSHGLTLLAPDGEELTQRIPVAADVGAISWTTDSALILAIKSQHTASLLDDCIRHVPPWVPIVCLQNGVDNERLVARLYPHVHGAMVICPGVHLQPGIVEANAAPVTGIIDVGRYPFGSDQIDTELAAALESATFSSRTTDKIMRWKWCKLLANARATVGVVCTPSPRSAEIDELVLAEARAAIAAGEVDVATDEEDEARRAQLVRLHPVAGHARPGNSTWQSLARGTGDIETPYFNGELVLLGRLTGVATPVNDLLQQRALEMAQEGPDASRWSPDQFLDHLRERTHG